MRQAFMSIEKGLLNPEDMSLVSSNAEPMGRVMRP